MKHQVLSQDQKLRKSQSVVPMSSLAQLPPGASDNSMSSIIDCRDNIRMRSPGTPLPLPLQDYPILSTAIHYSYPNMAIPYLFTPHLTESYPTQAEWYESVSWPSSSYRWILR